MKRYLPIERLDLTLSGLLRSQPFTWHGVRLNAPDWSHETHTLHLIINAFWEALEFELPALVETGETWRRCVDTYRDAPDDICGWEDAPAVRERSYRVHPRSVVVLVARTSADM
jgi:glycogen operon protein